MNKLTLSYFHSSLGFWLTSFLIPLMVLDLTGSALTVSVSYALNIVPYLLLTPFSGVLGDWLNRKKLIMWCELLCAICALCLFIAIGIEQNITILLFFGFLISSLSAFHHPIFQAIIPDLFAKEKIQHVNANIGMIDSLVGIIAPALLGIILLSVEKNSLLLFIAFCYLISFISIGLIAYQPHLQKATISIQGIFTAFYEGVHYVYQQTELRNIAILFFFINIGIRLIFPNLIWIYSHQFNLAEQDLSFLFILIGFGAVIGAKIGGVIIGKFSDITIIATASLIIGLCSLSLIFAPSAVTHALFWALSSLVQSVIVVTFFTYRQKVTAPFILSRVIAVTRLISYFAIPIAALSGGWIVQYFNSTMPIYLASGFIIFMSLAVFLRIHQRVKKPIKTVL
ncbi:MFS transporter [Testudinibacter sp. P80/BLE/0925]|uniref:MFS transporter n=1 Tax=Testudinibacter sp. TW-1 TaxID=3417757 RepID=UPI003D3609EA